MLNVQSRLCFVSLMVIAAQAQTAGTGSVSLSPSILRFSAAAGSNPAAAPPIALTTDPYSTWTATTSASWLTVSPASGTGPVTITAVAQTAAMLPGYYSAQIQVTQGTATASVAITLTVSAVAGTPIVKGNQWFVAPSGNPAAIGSAANPWDIKTGLSNTSIKPGDTVWLRGGHYGAGTVGDILKSSLVGTPTAPIIVRAAPGERVIIDSWLQIGCCDQANDPKQGSYTWFWGLEFAGFNPDRSSTSSDNGAVQANHASADTWGDGTKFINCIVHDTSGGLSVWNTKNSEVYGNLIYNVGGFGPDRGHGHDLYVQNTAPSFLNVADNIGLNNFDEGFQAYGSLTAAVQNMTFAGNIVFNSGILDGITLVDNFTIGGGGNNGGPSGITLDSNFTYDTPSLNQGQNELGYLWTASSNNAVVVNNYFIGGAQAVDLERWNALTFQNNTMYVENGSQQAAQSWLIYSSSQNPAAYSYNNNTYYGTNQFSIFSSCPSPADPNTIWPCPNGAQTVGWAQWQSATGLDKASAFSSGAPGGTWIHVRPNLYEPGRANIVVYNWGLQPTVSVYLAPSGIQPGTPFQIRDAENWFAAPVVSGTYTGDPVTIPMSNLQVVQPVGAVPYSPTHTAPQFGSFVLLPGNAYPTVGGSPIAPVHH